jgi:broad specificity phosphatase PhoE
VGRELHGNVLLFTSGHFIQALAAKWLKVELCGDHEFWELSAASLCSLSHKNERSRSMNRYWNEIGKVNLEPEIAARPVSDRPRIERIRRTYPVNT